MRDSRGAPTISFTGVLSWPRTPERNETEQSRNGTAKGGRGHKLEKNTEIGASDSGRTEGAKRIEAKFLQLVIAGRSATGTTTVCVSPPLKVSRSERSKEGQKDVRLHFRTGRRRRERRRQSITSGAGLTFTFCRVHKSVAVLWWPLDCIRTIHRSSRRPDRTEVAIEAISKCPTRAQHDKLRPSFDWITFWMSRKVKTFTRRMYQCSTS